MRTPNSPNPARHPLGNPKPGHLPRTHGNGGLGDARGPGGEGAPCYCDPSHGRPLTPHDSRGASLGPQPGKVDLILAAGLEKIGLFSVEGEAGQL